jgi:hypothetical protein
MAEHLTMIFWRDVYNEPGSVEYSWVPQGHRLDIRLGPDQQEGSGSDPGLPNVSHVQVYQLTNGRLGIGNWQFPPGPPHKSPVIAAIIQVLERRKEVIGIVHYADGTVAKDTHLLEPVTSPTL